MLFKCLNCGKISRVNSDFVTDWNNKIELKDKQAKCPSCNEWTDYKLMHCEDWVEDRVFKVKGN